MAKYKTKLTYDIDIDKLISTYDKALKQAKKAIKDEEKMNKTVEKDLNRIAWSAIADWYDSYDPYIYDRQEDLFNAYKVIVTDTLWDIKYSWKYMKKKHDVSNSYIFGNSFLGGFHGGARRAFDRVEENGVRTNKKKRDENGKLIDTHPERGIAYWRTPFPTFEDWGSPAQRDVSPYIVIEKEKKKYLDNKIDEYNQKIYDPLEQKIIDFVELLV